MGTGTAAVGFRETASASIRRYFVTAAERLSLHPEMRRLLSVPFRELTVELPLRRDDDRLQLFHGYRVQHNGVRGPVIGPVRLQAGLEIDVLRAAAESMTWRCAVANVPFGGAAGGIACDPGQLSRRELERLIRRYTARIHHVLGFYQDVCAPGPNAGTEVMSWISDEYSALQKDTPTAALGKPSHVGGLRERDRIIGHAVAALTARAAHDARLSMPGLRVAVRSIDQSAFHTARALEEMGCAVVAISEERGGVHCSGGIDIQALGCQLERNGSMAGFEGAAETVDVHNLDCDVLIIGAQECTLNAVTCGSVRAKLVIEASELVITPVAEQNLSKRSVVIIPDLVGAAANVLAANAEWSSNFRKLSSKKELPQPDIDSALLRAYEQVQERSRRDKTTMRTAAYAAAIERVARSERLRVA
jgi:glutamate dehydrogenase (NAD(P)+)